jgi:isoleucyl-tRNA synthetase
VKEIVFSEDDQGFVTLFAKPNFRVLGKKVGRKMPLVQKMIEAFTYNDLADFLSKGQKEVDVEGETILLTLQDVAVERVVKEGVLALNEGDITILLDKEMTPELIQEGLAREIVNKINTMRREQKFEVSDRIHIQIETTQKVKESFQLWEEYIMGEVLGMQVEFVSNSGTQWDLNGEPARLLIKKCC